MRLYFVDGARKNCKQRVLVQGQLVREIENFAGAGQEVEKTLSADETAEGKIDIVIEKLNPASPYAVVSTIELLTP